MSAIISRLCPYCLHDTGGFDVVAEHLMSDDRGHRRYQTLALCGKCKKAAVIVLDCPQGAATPMQHAGDYRVSLQGSKIGLHLVSIEPKPTLKIAPKHLPHDVAKSLQQAYSNAKANHWEVAMIMTRKALERAMKHIDPDGDKKQFLGQRIEKLSKKGLVPPAMVDWAFEITHLGNDAVHDACVDETEEDIAAIQQAIAFAEMFFTYTFTMPEDVRLLRERKK
ncbi:MAG: DUF4145 domain-containing protein [Ghiorsea sp.]